MAAQTIHVADHDIDVSNLDKEFYPDDHLSKGDVLDHYRAVADVMLPHLAGRPLTMRRYPDGIGADGFFQKDASDYFPDWLRVVEVPQRGDGSVNHVVCDDAAMLVYLVNQATIEFHVWLSTVDELDRPDWLVIDIDPPPGVSVATLRDVARRLRTLYRELGLTPFVQATGGRGYHVAAPLDRSADFRFVRDLAVGIADHLAEDAPESLTTAQRKERRGDRIFLDVNRNAYGQTFIAPYSLRARPGATVATPLDWAELGRSTPNGHTHATIRKRLGHKPDPWATIDEQAATPATARDRLAALTD
ncbi:bifunctional non-homologous end joining protein LigD [Nocardiopsis mwathae]|uniref:Bifunctional non-homologous end joining protein LigD n=1 Tax=Nocardiopsis mwathae TaxID=1472723 RepID=A0A7W9YE81_9ACTN|nr:non-homologous end-joining DNA ligase [Nocardiopsis mwathae]MBB6170533.1 bifunctional non-homologous end joining protein LigD [Nocardiopsis mwathae]